MLSTSLLVTSLMKISWQVAAFVLLVPAGLIWRSIESTLKKRFPLGVASLKLTPLGMSSPLLQGEHHSFAWSEVAGMTVKTVSNTVVMDFELHPTTPGAPSRPRRDFLGQRKAPRLPLDMFDATAQEAIVDAVNAAMVPGGTPRHAPSANPIAAERRFKDHLHALTPRTWVTWTLIAVNVAVWCAMVATSHDLVRSTSATLLEWGGNSTWEVQHGAWWRLGTSMFLHGGALHLILNMAALMWSGPLAERLFGPRQFLLLYGIAGLTGSASSLSFSAQAAISVGASGAIFGVAGALMTTVWRRHGRLPALFGGRARTGLTFYVFYSLSHGFGQTGVDNAAHLGGLGRWMPDGVADAHPARRRQRRSKHAPIDGFQCGGGQSAVCRTRPCGADVADRSSCIVGDGSHASGDLRAFPSGDADAELRGDRTPSRWSKGLVRRRAGASQACAAGPGNLRGAGADQAHAHRSTTVACQNY